MINGFQGKYLRVNLTNRTTSIEEPDPAWYRQYFGGYAATAYFLLKELAPGIDPLGPDNKLILASGPLTGAAFSGSARIGIGAKSPMTGGIGKSEVGGYFGTEMKLAGFDGIIVEGKADRPVYLWLKDGVAEIRDAGQLWGMESRETEAAIRAETGEKLARVACIGPAGENMVRFACVISDLHDAAGRTGLGAVMGSKNLKAIAARGKMKVSFADPARISELARSMSADVDTRATNFHRFGTGAALEAFNLAGNLPTRNYQDGFFPGAEKISAVTVKNTISIGMEGCWACAVRCKKIVKVDEPYQVDPKYGGPEYETIGAIGSDCGIEDLKAISYGSQICNANGMDTISAGSTIAFAMECFERGLLTKEDTGGIDLRFGNVDAMLQLLQMMARREGIGDLLAEGSRRAGQKIGRGAEELGMHVKGVELGMHEPRFKQGLGIGYSVANHGGDHEIGFHDTAFEKAGPLFEPAIGLGCEEPMPASELSDRKAYLFNQRHSWMMGMDSMVECLFVPWTYPELTELLGACTGWKATLQEIVNVGRRAITMGRVFNLREGFTRADDHLPKRFFSPPLKGSLQEANQAINAEAMDRAISSYYYYQGWSPEGGVPTPQTLSALGLEWVKEKLAEPARK
ncbi:MAG TPA: aldehyde ferredoxin oxidoreductase family protein [Chloroflexota bacterium]